MSNQRIGFPALAALAAPAFAVHAMGTPLTIYLPEFYANALGLDIALVGLAFMAVRLIDMAFDPVLGAVMDVTRTPWGRYKPWLAASAPILMLSMAMLFLARPGVGVAYLWLWLLIGFAGYSMIVLSSLSWAATLSREPRERTRIFAAWQIAATLGQLALLATPAVTAYFSGGDAASSIHAMGWMLVAVIPICIAVACFGARETAPLQTEASRARASDYFALFSRPGVARLLLADLLMGLGIGVGGAVALFFLASQLHLGRDGAGFITLLIFVAALAGAPLFTFLADRFGKARALVIGALGYACAQAIMFFVPSGEFWYVAMLALVSGMCTPAAFFLPRAMMADIADSERAMAGVERTGLLLALLNGTMKLALALSIGATFGLFKLVGFDPRDAGAPEHGFIVRAAATLAPAALFALAAICVWGFPRRNDSPANVAIQLQGT